jgi:hypothetical protein
MVFYLCFVARHGIDINEHMREYPTLHTDTNNENKGTVLYLPVTVPRRCRFEVN